MALKEQGRRGEPLAGLLVIDAHAHLGNEAGFSIPASGPEAILETMDRLGVAAACVSHLLALRGDVHRGNEMIAEACRRWPGRFLGYACAEPNDPDQIEQELDRCLANLSMRAIKIHADFQGYPIEGPEYQRVYEYAQRRGHTPVLAHGLLQAEALERLARAYPAVPFIVAHFGGYYHGRYADKMVEVLRRHDNVFTDLVSSVVPFGGLEGLVRHVGAEKLLYGSDVCYQEATHQIGRVLFAQISEREKEMILGRNAAALFGLAS